MEPRFFSLEEANSEVPKIRKGLEKITALNVKVKDLSKDVQELVNIWGEDIFNRANIDHLFYTEKIERRADYIAQAQEIVEVLQSSGCMIRDMELGLVDFFHKRGDEVLFLCWRYGEAKIGHWHPVNSGYTSRRPIEELMKLA